MRSDIVPNVFIFIPIEEEAPSLLRLGDKEEEHIVSDDYEDIWFEGVGKG